MYKKFLCFMYSVCMDSMSFYVNAFSSFASTPRADVFVATWSASFQHCYEEILVLLMAHATCVVDKQRYKMATASNAEQDQGSCFFSPYLPWLLGWTFAERHVQ